MTDRVSRLEASQFHRTLAGLATSYVGESAIIDLVNESCVAGRIEQIDAFMSVTLSEVVLIDAQGKYHLFDDLVVAPRKIRQIQLPHNLVDGDLLRDRLQHQLVALKQGHRGTPKEMTKMTGRRIRAEQRHQATLAELYNRKTPDAGGPPETSAEEEGPSGSGAAGH